MATQGIQVPTTIDVRKYIEVRLFDERPHIRNRRIPVGLLVRQIKVNDLSIEPAAYNGSLSEAEVLAALLYYEEHEAEIEQQEAAEDAKFDKMMALSSP